MQTTTAADDPDDWEISDDEIAVKPTTAKKAPLIDILNSTTNRDGLLRSSVAHEGLSGRIETDAYEVPLRPNSLSPTDLDLGEILDGLGEAIYGADLNAFRGMALGLAFQSVVDAGTYTWTKFNRLSWSPVRLTPFRYLQRGVSPADFQEARYRFQHSWSSHVQ